MVKKKNTNTVALNSDVKGPLFKSFTFHAIVVFVLIAGIPFFKSELPPIEQAIMVDYIEVAEERMTNKDEPPSKTKPNKNRNKADKSLKAPKRVTPPRVTSKAPPKIVSPAPPKIDKSETKPKKTISAALKPPTVKPTPPPPKADKKEEAVKQEEEDFQSVLKNLTPDAPTEKTTGEDETQGQKAPAFRGRFGPKMSMSEIDSLQAQLGRCWNLMAGARFAENLIVDLRLFMNPDGSLRKAEVVDGIKYNNDRFFRAAADSALRAVHNPSCTPLKLPVNKYDLWKTMIVTFDPREML